MLKVYQMFVLLLPLVQFKKCGKHPWRNVTFSKVARLHSHGNIKEVMSTQIFLL